uniref:Uncharacterized protein LOC114337184 n=1 Tax=Diabrotica virgifera virgifera TaxID=50390 RepID=A0A6P7G937_DIAVI
MKSTTAVYLVIAIVTVLNILSVSSEVITITQRPPNNLAKSVKSLAEELSTSKNNDVPAQVQQIQPVNEKSRMTKSLDVGSKDLEPVDSSSRSLWSTTWGISTSVLRTSAMFAVGIAIAGLLVFFYPVLAYNICHLVGGCQNSLDFYINKFIAENLNQRKPLARSRRDVEDFYPILLSLAEAHRKYEYDEKKLVN